MRKFFLTFSYCLLLYISGQAQDGYGNQWIFGEYIPPQASGTLLNFNGDTLTVKPIRKDMELGPSSTVMCDSAGKLLFYSNGCYIANAKHQPMTNGGGIGVARLSGYCDSGGSPLTQGIIALPKPGSNHLYYLFYLDLGEVHTEPLWQPASLTLYHAVIDMSLENGLGRVVGKNVVVLRDTFSMGQIQATRHANGRDWWVVQAKLFSNCYWTLLLTPNGIDTIFKQCAGLVWERQNAQGQAVFSPDNRQYARGNDMFGVALFNFDARTGLLSNPRSAALDTFPFNGLAFAPNSRFLYAPITSRLWQFDTWEKDLSAGRVLIDTLRTPPNTQRTRFNQARLGPDGKIYIAGTGTFLHLHVINRPNCLGTECDLQQYAIQLAGFNHHTMPNMPHYKRWDSTDTCRLVGTSGPVGQGRAPIRFFPNPAGPYLFSEGLETDDALQWVDLSGRTVKTAAVQSDRLDIADLRPGFYLLRVYRRGACVGVFKVVKE